MKTMQTRNLEAQGKMEDLGQDPDQNLDPGDSLVVNKVIRDLGSRNPDLNPGGDRSHLLIP